MRCRLFPQRWSVQFDHETRVQYIEQRLNKSVFDITSTLNQLTTVGIG